MKKFILALIVLVSSSAFASQDSRALYEALNVQEEPLSAPRTTMTFQKSVGGLTCVKVDIITEDQSNYMCAMNFARANTRAIYEALDVQVTTLDAVRTELKFQKSAGGVTCLKTVHVLHGDTYQCVFEF